jgi:hypothetical protein
VELARVRIVTVPVPLRYVLIVPIKIYFHTPSPSPYVVVYALTPPSNCNDAENVILSPTALPILMFVSKAVPLYPLIAPVVADEFQIRIAVVFAAVDVDINVSRMASCAVSVASNAPLI